jgi:hypothetical protein
VPVCGVELVAGLVEVVEAPLVVVFDWVVVALVEPVLVFVVEVELEVLVLCTGRHWVRASWLTAVAPWPRFCTRLALVSDERLRSALSSAVTAVLARVQEWLRTALETESSALTIVRLSLGDSRPLPVRVVPQAAANAAVRPSTAASSARGRNRREGAGTAG